ncbi:MAG: DUF1211 domain-containing protein [Sphingobacteriales bacterium]|nr:MAG: DUF1211 domain-containing protein [Sphingobacteriales bacterium]
MSNKTGFQVERIAFFSDAVFAIAITLMIIEVKPPHLHLETTTHEALTELGHITPMFVGVILSFVFIGLFWLRHHQLMQYVTNYNGKLIALNMAFLLMIVFLPFSTAFVFENSQVHTPVPMVFYNINYILAAFLNYRFFAYVLDKRNGLVLPDAPNIKEYKPDLLFPILVYALVACVALVNVRYAPLFYAAFALQGLFNKKQKTAKPA